MPPPPPPATTTNDRPSATLERRIARTGADLYEGLTRVLDAIPEPPQGPQQLARRLGVDKVLASRVLKAVRSPDPMSVLFRMPGPEPLRRLLGGAAREGVGDPLLHDALAAVDRFEHLIRNELGDRGTLDTIVSAWVPEARREFELRRKQGAFKAMSQLKGVQAQTTLSTVVLAPAADGRKLDIVWLTGLIGLQRLRPGAAVRFATRRVSAEPEARRPRTLAGEIIDDIEQGQLPEFSTRPLPPLIVQRAGDVNHYTLAEGGFGPRSAVNLVCAEVNLGEMRRAVPRGSGRLGYVFAEVSVPSRVLQFDAFVHADVYPGASPRLFVYDTVLEGIADVNDRGRDIDRLDVLESLGDLGPGTTMCRSSDVPRYFEMMQHVFETLGWDASRFRGHRCRIDYPIYGSQTVMAFDPPEE